jgi:hypothetical protein
VRRRLILCSVIAVAFAAVPSGAMAANVTAHSGAVSATFSWSGSAPNVTHQTLVISQAGTVVYDQPVTSRFCGTECWPGFISGRTPPVHVAELEGSGPPDVVLDLYSGGNHCCSVEQVFSLDAATMSYSKHERNFGDPGVSLADLRHNGRDEFVTADDSFAYEFTDFAASGLPIEILSYSEGRFHAASPS